MRPRTYRFSWLDGLLLVLVLVSLGFLVYLIEARLDYKWNWSAMGQYLVYYDQDAGSYVPNFLLNGLFTTIRLSVWAVLLGSIIGLTMGLARTSRHSLPRLLGGGYVELVRNLPPLVLIFIVYFFFSDALAQAIGLEEAVRSAPDWLKSVMSATMAEPRAMPRFLSATLTIALYEGAFITEIVRAGVQSVERGQWEAAYALGLSPYHRLRYVILPQALTRIIPPLTGQFISTIKDSSIVSIISVSELTFQGMELMAATYLTFEIWITVGLLYFSLTFTLSLLARKLEVHLARKMG